MDDASRPVTVLICAMGGEGGGVLMKWIVHAAMARDLPVQSTSVPGVAQRTGATTYYIELCPVPSSELDGREPVFSLYPSLGDIDLVVASELVEAGRAMERGFVHPERTTLMSSTHRVYSIAEKEVGGDGRYRGDRILRAASKMAKAAILFDAERAARESGSHLNAVLLGAIAGSGVLPIPVPVFEEAIRGEGKAVEANLAGFSRGLACGRGEVVEAPAPEPAHPAGRGSRGVGSDLLDRARSGYPEATHAIVIEGIARLIDYQGAAYASRYLDRLDRILAIDDGSSDFRLTAEAGRQLALWMSYEDVIRVAQLKTRAGRYERISAEVGAGPHDVVRVTEFLKPGIDEFCSLLPPFVARPIVRWASRRGRRKRLAVRLRVRTSTITGFSILWLLSKLRPLRPLGFRYREEQAMIEGWLEQIRRAAAVDQRLALEVVGCAGLIKGYGETRERGLARFRSIVEEILEPALAGEVTSGAAVEAVARSRNE